MSDESFNIKIRQNLFFMETLEPKKVLLHECKYQIPISNLIKRNFGMNLKNIN